jgi:tape measure domain-containing protein
VTDILVTFAPKGDDDVLDAVRKVTKHVGDLKRIAKTPIDLEIVKGSMPTEDFNRLVATVNRAKEATRDFGKEAAKASKQAAAEAAKAAREADKMAASFARASGSGGGRRGGGGSLFGTGDTMAGPDPAAFSRAAVNKVNEDIKNLNGNLAQVKPKAQAAAQGLGFVGRIIAAMAVRSFVREVYEMANAWTAFENKIKTVLTVQSDLAFVTKDLIGVSQRSRMSLEAVGTIYTRTSRAVQALGKSQIETMRFTETLSKAVAVGGATSIEAKNAMIQLSQGMSSGTLKGDELRSVLEQLPIVAQLIAEKMGVSVGQLRKLGSEGKLTTDVVFGAITGATARIEAQFAKMKPTMESVVQVIKDKFMVAIGQSSGAIDMATKALSFLSDNFDVAFRAASALVGIMTVMATGKFAMWMASGLANPWIALAAGIAAATVAFVAFSDKIEASNDGVLKLSGATDAWIKTFTKDIKEVVTALQNFVSILTGPIKLGWDLDTMMMRLAKLTDMARVLADPGRMALATVRNSPEDREWAQRTQNALKQERKLAVGAEKDAFWVKHNETEARFNAFMRGNMPGAGTGATPPPAKKGTKESGKTFEELIREATFQEGASQLGDIEEKIKQRLHRMTESLKPSIKKALDDVSGKGQIAALQKAFDKEHSKEEYLLNPEKMEQHQKALNAQIASIKSRSAALREQAKSLEELIRVDIHREEMEKSMIERDKIILKQTEEGIKKAKELADARRRMIEETADRQSTRFDSLKGIASSISPNFAVQQQVTELEKFRDFAKQNHLADWAKLATQRIEELKASMRWENTHFETFAGQMNSIFGPGGSLVKGFADAAANAIVMSQSLGDLRRALVDVLNSVQKQALSSLIQLPMNLALGALTNSITGGGGPSSFAAGSGGARSVSAAEASSWGFASGGYTGNMGINQPAGIVHGQEFVLNADATRRMGRQNLEMINKGGTPVSGQSAPANITINNNAGVQVETQQLSPGQVEIMITKAIRDQTGRVIAGQINDPNSMVSRSMQKNISSDRRRV